ncbi:uncharacterized protein MONOS_363 [Monocercomonoides exilis]|uniref:uncharacterized protein n=1 Tax=Monocercomonoides exilis TaxID=2049356 RepID=UPI0035597635|nr:hypothetical protein MONOS_363 [Monocercomonoides exilis]|eukprot:MONOS_363.1-p1 / transcript=MONOS_363.1 / gene=MONOS_363 / organism=Monocercomonoides_exilis_PA203 / gene_product=unspecified product / transcript_product=unspecified product / location=Mono_scaffold00006:52808-54550(+) / protein_length=545 / sequence_SO=supercontig / SO=protein_coding / is_pseudo=false
MRRDTFDQPSSSQSLYRTVTAMDERYREELDSLRMQNEQLTRKLEELEHKLTHYIDEQNSNIRQEFLSEIGDLNNALKEELLDVRTQSNRALLIGNENKTLTTALSTGFREISNQLQERHDKMAKLRDWCFFLLKLWLSGLVYTIVLGKRGWELLKNVPSPALHYFEKAYPPTKPLFEVYDTESGDVFTSPFFSVTVPHEHDAPPSLLGNDRKSKEKEMDAIDEEQESKKAIKKEKFQKVLQRITNITKKLKTHGFQLWKAVARINNSDLITKSENENENIKNDDKQKLSDNEISTSSSSNDFNNSPQQTLADSISPSALQQEAPSTAIKSSEAVSVPLPSESALFESPFALISQKESEQESKNESSTDTLQQETTQTNERQQISDATGNEEIHLEEAETKDEEPELSRSASMDSIGGGTLRSLTAQTLPMASSPGEVDEDSLRDDQQSSEFVESTETPPLSPPLGTPTPEPSPSESEQLEESDEKNQLLPTSSPTTDSPPMAIPPQQTVIKATPAPVRVPATSQAHFAQLALKHRQSQKGAKK